jgi:hypothetical protein
MVSSRHQEVVMEMNFEMTELSLDHLASVSGGGSDGGTAKSPPPSTPTNSAGSTTTQENRQQSDAIKTFQALLQEI